MINRIIIFALLILISFCSADDISFIGGCRLYNVYILTNTETILTIRTTENRIVSFKNPKIINIVTKEVNPLDESTLINCLRVDPIYEIWEEDPVYDTSLGGVQYSYSYTNLVLLPVSFIAFGLTYNAIDNIVDINDSIDELQNVSNDDELINKLKSERTKNIILGSLFLFAGVANTYLAFKPVRVMADYRGIGISYSF